MLDALIVGSGPTGLTLAIELLRWGLSVRLIDKAPVPPADASRALAIQARTLEVFHLMGLVDPVRERSLAIHAFNIVRPDGQRARLPIHTLQQLETPYPELRTLPQSDTEGLLQERLKSLRGHAERGVELQSYTQTADKVSAVLRSPRGEERVEARFIIGCDGSRSAVREQAGIAFEGDTYDDHCMVGDVTLDWAFPEQELFLFPSHLGIAVCLPTPEPKRYRIIVVLPNKPADRRELDLDEFLAPVRQFIRIPFTVTAHRFLSRYRLHHRVAARFRHQRAFLAGDAAHVHSPLGGQGMNTGIQDAFNLGWKLAMVSRGQAPGSLLESYESERRAVARHLIDFTDHGFGLIAGSGPVSRLMRRVVPQLLPRLFGVGPVQTRLLGFVSQLHVRYHPSEVVGERLTDGGRAPHPIRTGPAPGVRAPDVQLQRNHTAVRLFDLLRDPGHILLLFTGESEQAVPAAALLAQAGELAARTPGALRVLVVSRQASDQKEALHDASGMAHQLYGASEACAYLLRPDGHVGFRAQGIELALLQNELSKRLLAQGVPASKAS